MHLEVRKGVTEATQEPVWYVVRVVGQDTLGLTATKITRIAAADDEATAQAIADHLAGRKA